MRERLTVALLLAFAAVAPGCASSRMSDSSPSVGGWAQTPPQQTVETVNPAGDDDIFSHNNDTSFLGRYFPGFRSAPSTSTDSGQSAGWPRTSIFGLWSSNRAATPSQPVTYMTDARSGMNTQPAGETANLPVVIEVPTSRPASDGSVRPTAVNDAPATPAPVVPSIKKGQENVNPLPPALEPGQSAPSDVAGQMPEVPAVDPVTELAEKAQAKAAAVKVEATAPGEKADAKPASALAPSDDKAARAVPESSKDADPKAGNVATSLTMVSNAVTSQRVGNFKKLSDCKIFASPQSPKPAVAPTPVPPRAEKSTRRRLKGWL